MVEKVEEKVEAKVTGGPAWDVGDDEMVARDQAMDVLGCRTHTRSQVGEAGCSAGPIESVG